MSIRLAKNIAIWWVAVLGLHLASVVMAGKLFFQAAVFDACASASFTLLGLCVEWFTLFIPLIGVLSIVQGVMMGIAWTLDDEVAKAKRAKQAAVRPE